MREIIFRGLNEDGQWEYGGFFIKDGQPAIINKTKEWSGAWVKPESVGQYTGLKDRNGKMVYEGDILRGIDYENLDDPDIEIKPVRWDRSMFNWGYEPINDFDRDRLEIIGNIFETPELLEEAK